MLVEVILLIVILVFIHVVEYERLPSDLYDWLNSLLSLIIVIIAGSFVMFILFVVFPIGLISGIILEVVKWLRKTI